MVTFQVLYYVTTPDHTITDAQRGAVMGRYGAVHALNWRAVCWH